MGTVLPLDIHQRRFEKWAREYVKLPDGFTDFYGWESEILIFLVKHKVFMMMEIRKEFAANKIILHENYFESAKTKLGITEE